MALIDVTSRLCKPIADGEAADTTTVKKLSRISRMCFKRAERTINQIRRSIA